MIQWLIGLLMGLLAGLFFAPSTGKKFRGRLFKGGQISKEYKKVLFDELANLEDDVSSTTKNFYNSNDVQAFLKKSKSELKTGLSAAEVKGKEILVSTQHELEKIAHKAALKAKEFGKYAEKEVETAAEKAGEGLKKEARAVTKAVKSAVKGKKTAKKK